MNYQKLSNVMRNFDEVYLDDLLGDLKDVLIEWRIGESSLVLKQNKMPLRAQSPPSASEGAGRGLGL